MKKLDLIWNVTLVCPWDCEFCCTDAVHVKEVKSNIIARENSLSEISVIDPSVRDEFEKKYPGVRPTFLDLALLQRQKEGKEIPIASKMAILDNLSGYDVKIDFAGGDPLACYENFLLICRASEIFGRENISITSTGFSLKRYGVEKIAEIIGEYEFTYDEPMDELQYTRPKGYNRSNIKVAERFSSLGVRTKAQLPLTKANVALSRIEKIYKDLRDANITELLILRTFPVGRGIEYLKENSLGKSETVKAINHFQSLEHPKGTSVRLQCALQHLFEENVGSNPCDAMHKSFGINYQGKLLLSAWANGADGQPLSDDFVLGDITKQTFEEISRAPKFIDYLSRADDNFGHCKIFSYAYGNRKSIFDSADPLFQKL